MADSEAIRASFARQAAWCRDLGSPFTALVCGTLARDLDTGSAFGARILSWPGRPTADALPLRAAGALNALARSGRAASLAALYPPHPTPADDALAAGLKDAIVDHDRFLHDHLDSPPQTNEVGRSAAILAGCLVVAELTRLPLETFEIGASAGLNLGFDRYRYELAGGDWGDPASPVHLAPAWEGAPPPLDAPIEVAARAGCDVAPLDPGSAADRERLLAYVWPDQRERLARTEAAIAMAASAPWRVARADAAEWVEQGLAKPPVAGRARILVHTIMWQYMPAATQARIAAAMADAGTRATADTPLAWLRLEPDGKGDSAALALDLWPSGRRVELARGDFHGRWLRWKGIGTEKLASDARGER